MEAVTQMTNTLHRFGDAESFRDDYIVFAIASRGQERRGRGAQAAQVPGDGAAVQAGEPGRRASWRRAAAVASMNPLSHWKRDITAGFRGGDRRPGYADHRGRGVRQPRGGRRFREGGQGGGSGPERQHLDLHRRRGAVLRCRANLCRHSVGYSLGFEGKTEHLPNEDVLKLSTMCGHGMVSASLAKKMIDWVKEGRRTPEQAVTYLTRFCSCGVFNPSRGKRILEEARTRTK